MTKWADFFAGALSREKNVFVGDKKIYRAFTLVEILLVISLIALIAGMGAGLYKQNYESMLCRTSARNFLLAAKYARILAIQRQQPCKLMLDPNQTAYALVIEQNVSQDEQPTELIVRNIYFKPVVFPGAVRFEEVQIARTTTDEDSEDVQQEQIIFSSDGTAQPATIQIGDGLNHYTASINPATGKTKIRQGTIEDQEQAEIVDLDLMK